MNCLEGALACVVIHCDVGAVQDELISALLKSGKKEPAGLARCVAISSLGIFLYEELSHGSIHPKLKDAINVLLATLRVSVPRPRVSVGRGARDGLFAKVVC